MNGTSKPPDRPVFVLDENFPQPILDEALGKWVLDVDLRSIRVYEPRPVGGSDDWQVVLGLKQSGAQALITCDDNMLFVPRVVAVIEQTRFTVVTCRAAGHDPVLATGILLAHLPRIIKRHRPDLAQVWRLTAVEQRPIPIKKQKADVERRSGERVDDYKLSSQALQDPLLP